MPRAGEFFYVQCRDISVGGFSFFMVDRPEFKEIVVALGTPPHLNHFTARLCRFEEVEIDGRKGYMVGCQFCGRVHL